MIIDPQKIPSLYAAHGSLRAAAKALGVSNGSVQKAYRRAVELGIMERVEMGPKSHTHQKQIVTKQRVKATHAKRVRHKTYILAYAQNNTEVHKPTWESLRALADAEEAKIFVSQALYSRSSQTARDKGDLTGRNADKNGRGVWYDPCLIPYLNNERLEIAKGLVWCGELNISPTAERPLRGLEVYTGRASMIVPHTRLHMQSIATLGGSGAKLNYTTGTVTQRNYIQRKEGFKAEFHHTYGGLLVEVDDDGHWWTRQLSATSEGVICDLDRRVEGGRITRGNRVEAITFGDIHVDEIDKAIAAATWGEGGMVSQLNPRFQFFHDLLDFYRRSHHDIKNPYKMFKRFAEGKESVRREVDEARSFLDYALVNTDSQGVIIPSNHDRFLDRWLAEHDGRRDPVNARFWSDLNAAVIEFIDTFKEEPNYLKLALEMVSGALPEHVHVLNGGDSFVICPKHGGGIECGMHFDLGPNGIRGAAGAFAKLGRRSNGGHSHSATILDGAWQAGTKSKLVLPYNRNAPSSWSHTDIITHENSKRQMVTFFGGKWRA